MEIKKAIVDGKMYDVVSQNEFERRSALGNPEMLSDTLIQMDQTLYRISNTVDHNRNYPYAVRSEIATKFFNDSSKYPSYSSKNIIDFKDVKSNRELFEKQNKLRAEETVLLSSSAEKDFAPIIRECDSPALKLVKECLHEKHIDIDAYRTRFGSNCEFSNAIRLLVNPSNHNISISKMQMIAEKFDIEFEITARDISKSVPNPMNKTFRRKL